VLIYTCVIGPQTAQRLLAESPEREQRRQELVARKEALTKGMECLDALRKKYYDGEMFRGPEKGGSGSGSGSASGAGGFVTPPAEEVEMEV
jgi:hypothetical protein